MRDALERREQRAIVSHGEVKRQIDLALFHGQVERSLVLEGTDAQRIDPRQTLFEAVAEPLKVHGLVRSRSAVQDRVRSLAGECGLTEDLLHRRPHQISGGQAQRAALARALGQEPDVFIGDEPTAMLDVSVQAQVLGILDRRRRERGLSLCLISHDLDLVRAFCHRAGVLSGGRIIAEGNPCILFPASSRPPLSGSQEGRSC